MDLIPGLPNDLARHCLFRLHCSQLATLSSLSKAWKLVLQSRDFWRHRKLLCDNKRLILLKFRSRNIYKLLILEPETNIWSELPHIPEFPNGVPETFNFIVASFKWGFVLTGAFRKDYDDKTPFCNKIFVFDYISASWQRGVDMPEDRLSVYRCTSDRDRMVYVLCRQDSHTECIMVYDVMKDEWTSRIETREQGGYCTRGSMRRMIYQNGKIHFLDEWIQGGHNNDKRVFNVSTWTWEPPEINFLDWKTSGLCLSDDGEWYSYRCDYGTTAIYENSTWKDIVEEPNEWKRFDFITTWKTKALVIRGIWEEEHQTGIDFNFTQLEARVLDLKKHEWTTLEGPKEVVGTHVTLFSLVVPEKNGSTLMKNSKLNQLYKTPTGTEVSLHCLGNMRRSIKDYVKSKSTDFSRAEVDS